MEVWVSRVIELLAWNSDEVFLFWEVLNLEQDLITMFGAYLVINSKMGVCMILHLFFCNIIFYSQ